MVREAVQLLWQDKAAALKKGLGKVKAEPSVHRFRNKIIKFAF